MEAKRKEHGSRQRLLDAAARLLADRGTEVSTRAICEAAGVTAPTLYHHFGDRDGLLSAVVSHGFGEYLQRKRELESTGDPIEDIRVGWDDHVAWGTDNPAFYSLMYGQVKPGHHAKAADEAQGLLMGKLEAVAARGLLRLPPPVSARMIMSANVGLTLLLISQPDAAADALSARVRESMIAAITRDAAVPETGERLSVAGAAIALKSTMAAEPVEEIGSAERPLLDAWLDRLSVHANR